MALICQTDSRLANASRSWEVACDIDIGSWNKANEFILAAFALDNTPHGGTQASFKMQWRRAGGTFADVGADTEICWGVGTILVDGTEPVGGFSGCQTPYVSHENEGDNACTPSKVNPGLYLEIQWALGFGSGALNTQEYELQLYNTSDDGTAICSVSITTAAGGIDVPVNLVSIKATTRTITAKKIIKTNVNLVSVKIAPNSITAKKLLKQDVGLVSVKLSPYTPSIKLGIDISKAPISVALHSITAKRIIKITTNIVSINITTKQVDTIISVLLNKAPISVAIHSITAKAIIKQDVNLISTNVALHQVDVITSCLLNKASINAGIHSVTVFKIIKQDVNSVSISVTVYSVTAKSIINVSSNNTSIQITIHTITTVTIVKAQVNLVSIICTPKQITTDFGEAIIVTLNILTIGVRILSIRRGRVIGSIQRRYVIAK
jgi:hypothetical protein